MHVVTGGTGFIGSNIVAALVARGERVVVCDWFGDGDKWKNVGKHDLSDMVAPEQLMDWLKVNADRVQSIIHMGAISATTERDVDLIVRSNFQLSLRLWTWCAEHGCPFIYASSAATYGNGETGFEDRFDAEAMAQLRPLNPYGWSKLAFDRRVLAAVTDRERCPPKWAGLRFFNVYGPNEYHKGSMRSVVAVNYPIIAEGGTMSLFKSYRPEYADGGQMRDFVYVKDCVAVIMWMLTTPFPSDVYNIGSGEARPWLDLARAMFKSARIPEKIQFIDMPESLRDRYQYFTQASMQKLRAAQYGGRSTPLEEGIENYITSYLSKPDPYA